MRAERPVSSVARARTWSRAGVAVGAGLVIALLTGCTSGGDAVPTPDGVDLGAVQIDSGDRNGIEYVSGPQALEAVLRAVRSASSVSMTGSFTELTAPAEGTTTRQEGRTLDVVFDGVPTNYTATVTIAGVEQASVRSTGGRAAVSGDAGFAAASGLADATSGPVCVDSTDPVVTRFSPLLSPANLIAALVGGRGAGGAGGGSSGGSSAGGGVTVSTGAVSSNLDTTGEPTVQLVVNDGETTVGTLVVAATGEPYPISFTGGDATGRGSFAFARWNEKKALPGLSC
ncbi:hypothetical protein ACPEEZ_01470 [Frigoribacterium sp. 2-23]|uniref:hypothetical protein n=1 Tax=Frigoribacterium sp. 2-23 TaxID=3415006 RepID=UPI003C703032